MKITDEIIKKYIEFYNKGNEINNRYTNGCVKEMLDLKNNYSDKEFKSFSEITKYKKDNLLIPVGIPFLLSPVIYLIIIPFEYWKLITPIMIGFSSMGLLLLIIGICKTIKSNKIKKALKRWS